MKYELRLLRIIKSEFVKLEVQQRFESHVDYIFEKSVLSEAKHRIVGQQFIFNQKKVGYLSIQAFLSFYVVFMHYQTTGWEGWEEDELNVGTDKK